MSTINIDMDRMIAERIRIEREVRGWSLADLAEHSGLSRAMIHKIERGESSPTATSLGRLSGAFNLTMSALLARAETQGGGRLLRRADQPEWIDPQTGYIRRHVSPHSDQPIDIVHVELPPGAVVPMPASAFTFLRQHIWMLEGNLVFVEGDVRHEMVSGDCLALGAPVDCEFRNESATSCRYCVVILRNT